MKFRYRIIVTPYNLRAHTTNNHSVCTVPLCTPAELPLNCRRPYCAAMATLRRRHCALLRTLLHRQATALVLSMLNVRAIVRRSMRSKGVYWRCHCVTVESLRSHCAHLGVLHFTWTPWTLLCCDRGLTTILCNHRT